MFSVGVHKILQTFCEFWQGCKLNEFLLRFASLSFSSLTK